MSSNDHPLARPTVLITWPDFGSGYPEGEQRLRAAGLDVRLEPKLGARSEGDMLELLSGTAAAIVSTDPFSKAVIYGAPDLRVIARVGVGTDSIDLDAAAAAGVTVTVTTGASEATVADHAMALMLAALRDVVTHDERVKAGLWVRTGAFTPSQLTGAAVLIVGFGAIGRLVRDRVAGFGTRVLVCDPEAEPQEGIEIVGLEDGLREADVVTVHTPLTEGTRGMIGERELALLKPGAVLINLARGGVVDEDALDGGIRAGRPARAGLDVFVSEPPVGSALLTLPEVVVSPHIGGLSHQSIRAMLERCTTSVIDVLAGRHATDALHTDGRRARVESWIEAAHD